MIQIVEHQRSWSIEFQEIRKLLKSSLGNLALRIDHIGSTAIPGLCAKDILDVQVSVAELTPKIIAAMNEVGFGKHPDVNSDHIPPGFIGEESAWSKYFFMQPVGQRRVNVHVRKVGNPNQRYAILFRDYLIANRSASLAYGELKRRLAGSLKNDADYPQVKDPAVDLIYCAAEQWALHSGWNINAKNA